MSTGTANPVGANPVGLNPGTVSALPMTTRRVRAYFAPVNRAAGTPTIFDPSQSGAFALDAPPVPWVDLGWISGFARKSESTIGVVTAGNPVTAKAQTRQQLAATVQLRFLSWSKLSMALAAGSQHMNLLAPSAGSGASPSGAKGVASVAVAAGSTATFVSLAAADAATFSAGQIVTVDVDYKGQTGFVGSGVSAAYVKNASDVNNDADYIRRVSFNVARVAASTSSGLQLAQPLPAGAPVIGMRVQPILGFVDREGGTFFQEWSALFVIPGEQGDRILYHYPRLQAATDAEEVSEPLSAPLEQVLMNATFRALPVTDPNDGEQALCFRSYLPGANALV